MDRTDLIQRVAWEWRGRAFSLAGDKTVSILKAMLCRYCSYFRGLLFLDLSNPTNTIDLEDVSIEVMTSLLGWLYHKDLYFLHKTQDQARSFEDLSHLVDIYIFADKYDFVRIRNQCVKYLRQNLIPSGTFPKDFTTMTWQAFGKAFSHLPQTAKFRTLLLGYLCYYLLNSSKFDTATFDRMAASLPTHVFVEISGAFIKHEGPDDTCVQLYTENWKNPDYWQEPDDSPCALISSSSIATHLKAERLTTS
ncbi:hypothetical protein MRB53_040990 [Persea americana]|nr:hypothetical protein MRB53_040990 [Persea americana]